MRRSICPIMVSLIRRVVHIHQSRGSPPNLHGYFRKFLRAWNKGKLSSAFHSSLIIHISPSVDVSCDRGAVPRRNRNALLGARASLSHFRFSTGRCWWHLRHEARPIIGIGCRTCARGRTSLQSIKRRSAEAGSCRGQGTIGGHGGAEGRDVGEERARRESDRTFRGKGDDGYEANDSLGGDGFRDQWVFCIFLPACLTA